MILKIQILFEDDMSAVNSNTFANKKPILDGSNIMSSSGAPVNNSIGLTGITPFGTTIGTTEVVADTVAISVTSSLNTASCFAITSINTNTSGAGRAVTFRIRLDDVNGTIIGTSVAQNSAVTLFVMQAVLDNIPNTTTQIVFTRQYTGSLSESGTQDSSIGNNLYVTITESTDTHTTKNANLIRG